MGARRTWVLALGLFVLSLWMNLAHVDSTKFHRDEARWVYRAHYLRDLRDPFGDNWAEKPLARGQPPLGSYLMGLGLVLQGRDLTTNGLWSFFHDEKWNKRTGRYPEAADLTAARRTNAVVGALSVVVVFLIAASLTNRVGGVAAALLTIPHPTHIYLSSLAGSDALLGLLALLAALTAIRLADRPSWPRAITLGIVLGLGAATKLSPLLVAFPLAALGAGFILHDRLPRRWTERRMVRWLGIGRAPRAPWRFQIRHDLGWMLLSLPLVAGVVFVAAYPYLWTAPISHSANLFTFRAQEMDAQGAIWTELNVSSPLDAVVRVGRWLGDRRSTSGWLANQTDARFGVRLFPRFLDLVIGVAGSLLLIVIAVRRGLRGPHELAAIVLWAQVGIIIVGMRADFERYQEPILLALAVCSGVLTGTVWTALQPSVARIRSRVGIPHPSPTGHPASVRGD